MANNRSYSLSEDDANKLAEFMGGEVRPQAFSNGLSPEENEKIIDIQVEIASVIARIEDLGRHRSYACAVTKLDEARHWLADRIYRAP